MAPGPEQSGVTAPAQRASELVLKADEDNGNELSIGVNGYEKVDGCAVVEAFRELVRIDGAGLPRHHAVQMGAGRAGRGAL